MCSACKVQLTAEKQFQCSTVSADIAPTSCEVDQEEDLVNLTWADGHKTSYPGAGLRAFAEKPNGEGFGTLMAPPQDVTWQPWHAEYQPHKVPLHDLLTRAESSIRALEEFLRHGVMVITEAGSEPRSSLERLASLFGPMHEVLFERVHNVVLDPKKLPPTNEGTTSTADTSKEEEEGAERGGAAPNPPCYNIAHTGLAVPPHNDFASYSWNPSVQCLHMLVNEADGGQSCVIDGWASLYKLKKETPEFFDVLCRFKVPWREFDENNETYTEMPIIRCDPQTGEVTGIRFSNQLMQAINPLHPDATLFYKAYHALSTLLMGTGERDNSTLPDRRRFRLHGGQIIVVAAHRVLHARTKILPTGYRHLQDAYFCHDNLRNKLTLLLRKQEEEAAKQKENEQSNDGKKKTPTTTSELTFISLAGLTKADSDNMAAKYNEVCTASHLAARSIAMLQAQDTQATKLGCRVTLYEHGLQCATRAHRAGADEETVVVALLHDIGELISPSSHGDIAAGILQPYISAKNQWVLRMHEVFQGFHYFEHVQGANKYKRDEWKSHEFYPDCVKFCDEWDQTSFDDKYESLPLEFFRPMVESVFAKEAYWWDPTHPKAVAVLGAKE